MLSPYPGPAQVIRGNYDPLPTHYSEELRDVIGLMLCKTVKKRPEVNELLQHPSVVRHVQVYLDSLSAAGPSGWNTWRMKLPPSMLAQMASVIAQSHAAQEEDAKPATTVQPRPVAETPAKAQSDNVSNADDGREAALLPQQLEDVMTGTELLEGFSLQSLLQDVPMVRGLQEAAVMRLSLLAVSGSAAKRSKILSPCSLCLALGYVSATHHMAVQSPELCLRCSQVDGPGQSTLPMDQQMLISTMHPDDLARLQPPQSEARKGDASHFACTRTNIRTHRHALIMQGGLGRSATGVLSLVAGMPRILFPYSVSMAKETIAHTECASSCDIGCWCVRGCGGFDGVNSTLNANYDCRTGSLTYACSVPAAAADWGKYAELALLQQQANYLGLQL